MFDLDDDASKREKCFTTIAELPSFVDAKQIPSKRQPFSTILNHPFVHTVEAILPADVYTDIQAKLDAKLEQPRYARVFMSPSDILEHDFFNTYIKSGNILMISEGRSGLDNVFSLRDGIMRIELGKEIYERTGLSGRPIRGGGRKHEKERFALELNFRLPSMLHGKKSFDRILWAFKNVLDQSLAWLFCDLEAGSNSGKAPITKLHPQSIESRPVKSRLGPVLAPPLPSLMVNEASERESQETLGALAEWLAMVQLNSPRVSAEDKVDPYLSRYAVPDFENSSTTGLISLKWSGLVSPSWTMQLFVTILSHTSKPHSSPSWFALSASALDKQAVEGRDGFTIMVAPNVLTSVPAVEKAPEAPERHSRHAICWEFVGATSPGA